MKKTFNFYCDESCHLERDGIQYMIIGYTSSPLNQVRMHYSAIRDLKKRHNLHTESKWSSISKSSYPLYNDLIDYFFSTDLQYRAIVIDKSVLRHGDFEQDHDDFYFKMYYQLLSKKLSPENNYNIYLDIKDTRSAKKVNGLKKYLNSQFVAVNNLQNIRSHESEIMQLTDILTGAISYHLRGLSKMISKTNLIEKIQIQSNHSLLKSTHLNDQKFNLFFIDLK